MGADALTGHSHFQVITRRGDQVLFRVEGERALASLLEQLRAKGASLHSVAPRRHTLEERFLDVVEGRRP